MKPVLKYRGGKSKEIPLLLPHIPLSFNRYVEPFLGGGAVFFHLEPEESIIGDKNQKLMTFYEQLRNSYPKMRRQLDQLESCYEQNQLEYRTLKDKNPEEIITNKNDKLYYKMRKQFNYPNTSYLEGAVYYFINKTAYSGMIRYNKKGEFNVPFGRYPHLNTKLITQAHSDLLNKAELHCCDYSKTFDMVKNDDFVFLDPPYDCVFNDYGNLESFNESEQRRLAEDFKNLPCKALMVIGETDITKSLYSKYIVEKYHKNYSVNIKNRFKNDKTHLIVKNF